MKFVQLSNGDLVNLEYVRELRAPWKDSRGQLYRGRIYWAGPPDNRGDDREKILDEPDYLAVKDGIEKLIGLQ